MKFDINRRAERSWKPVHVLATAACAITWSTSTSTFFLAFFLLGACARDAAGHDVHVNVEPATIFSAENGTLHINSAAGQPVFLNGVDLLKRLEELEAQCKVQQNTTNTRNATSSAAPTTAHPTAHPTPTPTPSPTTPLPTMVPTPHPTQEYNGDVDVSAGGACSLDFLRGVTHINGNVFITCATPSPSYLEELSALQYVSGTFQIFSGADFEGTSGLRNLASVGNLFIRNTNIRNLSLPALTGSTGFIRIVGNTQLVHVNLGSISSTSAEFHVTTCPLLENLDSLASLQQIGGSLELRGNDKLSSIDGLLNVTSVGGSYVKICYNQALAKVPSHFIQLAAGKTSAPNDNLQCARNFCHAGCAA